jgi:hypothetical protein
MYYPNLANRTLAALVCVLVLSCAYIPLTPSESYLATVLYQQRSFAGTSLSNETVLILPALTKTGPDSMPPLSPLELGELLQGRRGDVQPVPPEEFEAHCKAAYGQGVLNRFYKLLYSSNVVAIQNSDSVWKQMKTGYCSVTRITRGLRIRGFEGSLKRKMVLETELWSVDSAEAVWRVQVECTARGDKPSDAELVRRSLQKAFDKIPVFAPGNNERNW